MRPGRDEAVLGGGVVRWVGVAIVAAALMVLMAVGVLSASAAGTSSPQSSGAAADGLIGRLAILRRPQTAQDELPPGTTLPPGVGTLIPGLTRLVGTLPTMKLFVVALTPAGGAPPLWSPRLGDQVAVVAVGTQTTLAMAPFPAADLNDPFNLGYAGARASAAQPSADIYNVEIVPDGVSRVQWRFANQSGTGGRIEDAAVADNVAIAPYARGSGTLRTATWYDPDGAIVPTSDRVLLRAIAARQTVLRKQAIGYARHHLHRAAPALLADFAVFSVTSHSPVHAPGGLTISHPGLSDLPLPILRVFSHGGDIIQADLRQTREVTNRSGYRMWVIPGARGLCVGVLDRSPFLPVISGGGGACSGTLARALSDGVALLSGSANGTTTDGVLPKSKPTITLRIAGHNRVIRPPYGVYIVHNPARRARQAAPARRRIHVPTLRSPP